MKKTLCLVLSFILIAASLLSLASCGTDENTVKKKTLSYTYFHTVSSIFVYSTVDDETFNSYAEEAQSLLEFYHKRFDIYFDYSGINNLRTINQNAGKQAVEVDDETIKFLEFCKELFTLTNGKTNVMMGSVLKIWHNHREDAEFDPTTATAPTEAELSEAMAHTSIDLLEIDKDAGTVYISDPKASLDVGAIGKGYATEMVCTRLKEMGADSVALNIGGNIRTIGLKPDGSFWETGITNPDKSSSDFATKIALGETSCVTSGDYERYFYADGVKYHHIIDPATSFPAAYFSSVTILTENSALADALSTALFCVDHAEGLEILQNFDEKIDVIWIGTDGTIQTTDGVQIID